MPALLLNKTFGLPNDVTAAPKTPEKEVENASALGIY